MAREYPEEMRRRLESEHPDWTEKQVDRAVDREKLEWDIYEADHVEDLRHILIRMLDMIP